MIYEYAISYQMCFITLRERIIDELGDKQVVFTWKGNEGKIYIEFPAELTTEEKDLLDAVMQEEIPEAGNRPMGRIGICTEIFRAVSNDPSKVSMVMDALDAMPSFIVALDAFNYSLAKVRLLKALNDSLLTQEVYDIVLSKIPKYL